MSKTQRDYYLREQLRQIRHELGDDGQRDEVEDFKDKISTVKLSPDARAEADKQLRRLEMMSPESAEATVVRNYLETLMEIPWEATVQKVVDLGFAQRVWTKIITTWSISRSEFWISLRCCVYVRLSPALSCVFKGLQGSVRRPSGAQSPEP